MFRHLFCSAFFIHLSFSLMNISYRFASSIWDGLLHVCLPSSLSLPNVEQLNNTVFILFFIVVGHNSTHSFILFSDGQSLLFLCYYSMEFCQNPVCLLCFARLHIRIVHEMKLFWQMFVFFSRPFVYVSLG